MLKPRVLKYLLLTFQLNDKSKHMEESMGKQVANVTGAISKFRKDLSRQHTELQKTIENIAARLRAINNANLSNQVGYYVLFVRNMRAINTLLNVNRLI